MVGQGLGVSIMPELLLRGRTEGVRVSEIDPPMSRTIALAYAAGREPTTAAERFADCVADWVKDHS